jgi:hypothetical protein
MNEGARRTLTHIHNRRRTQPERGLCVAAGRLMRVNIDVWVITIELEGDDNGRGFWEIIRVPTIIRRFSSLEL